MARRRRRTRAIIGALVVLVLAGAAATVFTLDYHKAKSNADAKKIETAKVKAAAGVQMVGTVTAHTATSMTVLLPNGQSRRLVFTAATRVQDARTGVVSDVKQGTRAVLHMKSASPAIASEILVLPATGRIGQPVGKTGFGYVWLRGKTGHLLAKVNITGARVDHGVSAGRSILTDGVAVVVHAQTTLKPVRYIATEIVVLPKQTALAG